MSVTGGASCRSTSSCQRSIQLIMSALTVHRVATPQTPLVAWHMGYGDPADVTQAAESWGTALARATMTLAWLANDPIYNEFTGYPNDDVAVLSVAHNGVMRKCLVGTDCLTMQDVFLTHGPAEAQSGGNPSK